jgi:hypothetical protein
MQLLLLWENAKESEYRHTETSSMKRALDIVIGGLDLTRPFIKWGYLSLADISHSGVVSSQATT